MNAPVNRITIHHEGAGNPVDWARGGYGGYSIWIGDENGDHVYDILRNPWISYATLNFNHVSLDICLSGNRCDPNNPITQADIDTIRAAVAQARALGWVVDQPYVIPHTLSPGSSTVCPCCSPTVHPLTWVAIVTACHKELPPMPPSVAPHFFPPIDGIVDVCTFGGTNIAMLRADGHVFCDPPSSYKGSPYDDATGKPKAYWVKPDGSLRVGATIAANSKGGYTIVDTATEPYAYPEA